MPLKKQEIVKLCGDNYYPNYMANNRSTDEFFGRVMENLLGNNVLKTIFLSRYRKENAIVPVITNYIASNYNMESLLMNSDIYKIPISNTYVIILKSNHPEIIGKGYAFHAYPYSDPQNSKYRTSLENTRGILNDFARKTDKDIAYIELCIRDNSYEGKGSVILSNDNNIYNSVFTSSYEIKFVLGVELPIEINGISISSEDFEMVAPIGMHPQSKLLSYVTSGGVSHREIRGYYNNSINFYKFDAQYGQFIYQSGFAKFIHRGIEDIYDSNGTLEIFKTYKGDINDI